MNDAPESSDEPASRSWWDRLGNLFSGQPRSRDDLVEELRSAHVNGLLSADTLRMLEGALKVTELSVDDVMVPRMQIVMIATAAPLTQILATVVESGHSRFPVYGRDKNDILGIILAKDLLPFSANHGTDFNIHAILRPAMFIPEAMRLNVLLGEFRRNRNHMALVIDEYGDMAGLITIEDVLEQIVGDIDDEYDEEETPMLVYPQDDDSWLVSALMPIEDFNQQLGSHFSDTEFDTIGGLITHEFGHLPAIGEETMTGQLRFRVTIANDRRVQQFHVTRCEA